MVTCSSEEESKSKSPPVTRRDRWGTRQFQIKARATRPEGIVLEAVYFVFNSSLVLATLNQSSLASPRCCSAPNLLQKMLLRRSEDGSDFRLLENPNQESQFPSAKFPAPQGPLGFGTSLP